jgi:hypothetical protein
MARPAANPYAVGEAVRSELNLRDTALLEYTEERVLGFVGGCVDAGRACGCPEPTTAFIRLDVLLA